MSGKSCGISDNGERRQYMLGSNFLNRTNNNNNNNHQLVNAIKQNKSDMMTLQRKTEHLEQSLLIQRSLESSQNNNTNAEIEHKIKTNLDLVRGEFKGQIKLLKDYVKILEQKIADLENKIIKKTPVNQKKEEPKKEEPKKEVEKPKENKVVSKKEPTEKENVTLEIKEK